MVRSATVSDIPRLIEIRGSVRENRLSDPNRVTIADYEWHIVHGSIHIWEENGVIAGLSASDPRDGNAGDQSVNPTEGRGPP